MRRIATPIGCLAASRTRAIVTDMAEMIDTVVFDLGGVLIDWDPRYVLTADGVASADELMLALDIDGAQRELDLGTPVARVHATWRDTYADRVDVVDRYFRDWHSTIGGPFDDVVSILRELRDEPVRLYALSNFSGELFRQASPRFDFLAWFDGLVISGDEGVIKPDPRIYRLLLERYGLEPARMVFIDDRPENVDAARAAGLVGIDFVSAPRLRRDLIELGVLAAERR
jgi:2-haloacid dehalogenase